MFTLSPLLPAFLALTSFAQDSTPRGSIVTYCEHFFGAVANGAVHLAAIDRVLSAHTDVRPLYRSNIPGASLIILVSRDREPRAEVAREVAQVLGVPTLVPGESPQSRTHFYELVPPAIVNAAPPEAFNALALIENIGSVRSSYWGEGDTFLSHFDLARRRRVTYRHNSVATLALMQSRFEYGTWANQPLRTLFDNVRLESDGVELVGEAVRKLAGIYYVGRTHEMFEEN